MKLFYLPGACSLATHISLLEVNETFEIEKVNHITGTTESGINYKTINVNGYVPALQFASQEVLTEGPAILQYIADQHPESGLLPAFGTLERARVLQFLNYVGSEFHKAVGPLFNPELTDLEKEKATANIHQKLDYLNNIFSDGRKFIEGSTFTVADAYLFVVCTWPRNFGMDLSNWPFLVEFMSRVAQRSTTQAAMKAEGLAA